jgi:hypothetical protein
VSISRVVVGSASAVTWRMKREMARIGASIVREGSNERVASRGKSVVSPKMERLRKRFDASMDLIRVAFLGVC